ncbi:MAG: PEP-CTERM sorting domain-containing protein [Planctomycetota bacterium]
MQNDLDANYPQLDIRILGVNGAGLESGNAFITSGRDIPWLQDLDLNGDGWSDVWRSWNVTYRDVVILDAENARVGTFNLTTHDLRIPASYDTLRRMFVDAASVPEPASLTLLVIGAAGLLTRTRGRRKT